jgi:hypothetical protein
MSTSQNGIVLLEVKDGLGCVASYDVNVEIPVLGNPGFETYSIGQSFYGLFAIKDPIEFKNTATGDFETIIWNFGDGTISSEMNPAHSYLKEGV